MIRLTFAIELTYEIAEQPADFIFNVHAAHTPWQTVVSERVTTTPPLEHVLQTDAAHGNRYMRLRAPPGPLMLRYEATVDIEHHRDSPASLEEMPVALERGVHRTGHLELAVTLFVVGKPPSERRARAEHVVDRQSVLAHPCSLL